MTELPLHPKIVHLPIALAMLVPLLATGLAIALWLKKINRGVWVIALIAQILLVASAFAAMQTGETDEEIVEAVVAEEHIEQHEEAAEIFFWAAIFVLLLIAGAQFVPSDSVSNWLAAAGAVCAFVVLALGVQVGQAGGELVYKYGAAAGHIGTEVGNPATPPDRHDDDDDDD